MSGDKNKRKGRIPEGSVCKPCWELRYCPYGSLVEYFPLLGSKSTPDERKASHDEAISDLRTVSDSTDALDAVARVLYTDPTTWEFIEQYDPEDVGCRIFGHVCPVFFSQSGATETKEARSSSRYIARSVMLQVVRRDNHVCQACLQYVRDDEIEFDHTIPLARGGATSVENLRLLCRKCNNRKSDRVDELLVRR